MASSLSIQGEKVAEREDLQGRPDVVRQEIQVLQAKAAPNLTCKASPQKYMSSMTYILYQICIYGTALGTPTPPPPGDGHGSLPRPLWEWVGWLWMGGNAG